MKPTKQARTNRARRDRANEFYEVMPMTMSSHYVYRDDADDDARPTGETSAQDPQAAARRVAIITLVVLAVVAGLAGFALAEGLGVLQSAMGLELVAR